MLELLYQDHLRVFIWRISYLDNRLLYALIMLFTCLVNDIMVPLPGMVDDFNRAIKLYMPTELQLGLLLLQLLSLGLSLDDLPLFPSIFFSLEHLFSLLHLSLHLLLLSRLHLLLNLLGCCFLSLLHELPHLGFFLLFSASCPLLFGDCIELCIYYGIFIGDHRRGETRLSSVVR